MNREYDEAIRLWELSLLNSDEYEYYDCMYTYFGIYKRKIEAEIARSLLH